MAGNYVASDCLTLPDSERSDFGTNLHHAIGMGSVSTCRIFAMVCWLCGLPRWFSGKELPASAGDARDMGSIPG